MWCIHRSIRNRIEHQFPLFSENIWIPHFNNQSLVLKMTTFSVAHRILLIVLNPPWTSRGRSFILKIRKQNSICITFRMPADRIKKIFVKLKGFNISLSTKQLHIIVIANSNCPFFFFFFWDILSFFSHTHCSHIFHSHSTAYGIPSIYDENETCLSIRFVFSTE